MTEINTVKIGARLSRWVKAVSRFTWPFIGILCTLYGLQRLTRNEDIVLGYMNIVAGITVTILPLTSIKCPQCSARNSFHKVWEDSIENDRFACQACKTHYQLPFWNSLFKWIIMIVWFIVFLATLYKWLHLNIMVTFLDTVVFANALLMLLIRFSHYKKLNNTRSPNHASLSPKSGDQE